MPMRLRQALPLRGRLLAALRPGPLVAFLTQREVRGMEESATATRFACMDGDLILPEAERGQLVSGFIPVVYGCSHACTFCIIPYRRGVERSRPPGDILAEARALVAPGRQGNHPARADRRPLRQRPARLSHPGRAAASGCSEIEGLERIRFLTSHPNWMTDELLDAVADLPKVMPHIEVPVQAGDDEVLANMHRGYTGDDYRRLVERIRQRIPDVSIATDIIVGFPGETEEQFQHTYDLLAELKLDVAHLARYSTRPGTVATRRMADDVAEDEKMRRFRLLEDLQEQVLAEINARYLGQTVAVLFEEKVKERWKGRTPTNKLVFAEAAKTCAARSARCTSPGPVPGR